MSTNKKYWGEGCAWKTESAFMSWIRGGIRRALWNRSPVKITFLNKVRERIPNPNPKGKSETVWGCRCNICNNLFPSAQIEVDHKEGQHQLKTLDDIAGFIKGIVLITEDDLQAVCKPCHKIKSHQEKKGLTYAEAYAEKTAIKLIKDKKDKLWLEQKGITPASNQKARREQIIEYLKDNVDE